MKYRIANHIVFKDMTMEEELAIVKTLSLLQIPFKQHYIECSQDLHIIEVNSPYDEYE